MVDAFLLYAIRKRSCLAWCFCFSFCMQSSWINIISLPVSNTERVVYVYKDELVTVSEQHRMFLLVFLKCGRSLPKTFKCLIKGNYCSLLLLWKRCGEKYSWWQSPTHVWLSPELSITKFLLSVKVLKNASSLLDSVLATTLSQN